jgi:transcriptional regulator with XRE-family HTH domain
MTTKGKKAVSGSMPDEIKKKVGVRFKGLREQQGYSNYEKFANAKDLNRAQYGRYEKGTDLRISSLAKVVKAFDMTLAEFFAEGFDDL